MNFVYELVAEVVKVSHKGRNGERLCFHVYSRLRATIRGSGRDDLQAER